MKKNSTEKSINTIGIIVGILLIIVGLFGGGYWTDGFQHVGSISYGGDPYTEIQNAAAATANNVKQLASNLSSALQLMFIASGVIVILHYSKCMAQLSQEKVEDKTKMNDKVEKKEVSNKDVVTASEPEKTISND